MALFRLYFSSYMRKTQKADQISSHNTIMYIPNIRITNSRLSPLHFQARFSSNSLSISEEHVQEKECLTHAKPRSFAWIMLSFSFLELSAKTPGERSFLFIHPKPPPTSVWGATSEETAPGAFHRWRIPTGKVSNCI